MCENCRNLFDIKRNLPYVIPCGHTICQRCINALEYKNNKMKCPIDYRIYEIPKEKIPKNHILIDYMKLCNNMGLKYSYQIKKCVIEGATFSHIDKRNCFQKLCHILYILIYVKIFLTILNIILWPFKKMIQLLKAIFIFIYIIYLKLKELCIKIINKIISIRFLHLNYFKETIGKLKDKFIRTKFARAITRFYKFTISAPLWINYLKIMKNLIKESQLKAKNICTKIVNTIMAVLAIFFAHLIAYFTNNLENFLIIILLLNESTAVLIDLMEMGDKKDDKNYNKNNKDNKKKKEKEKICNHNEEYLIDKYKYFRGKKCAVRWIGFIIFWYFFPLIKTFLFDLIGYLQYNKNDNLEQKEKNVKIWIGIINSLLIFPKLIIIIYITC